MTQSDNCRIVAQKKQISLSAPASLLHPIHSVTSADSNEEDKSMINNSRI